jgi:hypothetical protein
MDKKRTLSQIMEFLSDYVPAKVEVCMFKYARPELIAITSAAKAESGVPPLAVINAGLYELARLMSKVME